MPVTNSVKCQKCLLKFSPGDIQKNLTVKCYLCSNRFHNSCRLITNELSENISAGIVCIICDQCKKKYLPEISIPSVESSAPPNQNSLPNEKGTHTRKNERKNEICRYFLNGQCKFGDKCIFGHTKFCWNLIRTGSCLDVCVNRLFHEYVCEDSKKTRKCLNLACEKYHISGTGRVDRSFDKCSREKVNYDYSENLENANYESSENLENCDAYREPVSVRSKMSFYPKGDAFPKLHHRGTVEKTPVSNEREDFSTQGQSRRVQRGFSYANSVTMSRQESNQLQALNVKIAQQQSRIQNTEKLLQQVLVSNSYNVPISQEKEKGSADHHHKLHETAWSKRFQNTENAVSELCKNFNELSTWIKQCHQPVNSQLQPNRNMQRNPSCDQNGHEMPLQTPLNQARANQVFHYPGLIPTVMENFGDNAPSYVPL